jgi:hypothetical protein
MVIGFWRFANDRHAGSVWLDRILEPIPARKAHSCDSFLTKLSPPRNLLVNERVVYKYANSRDQSRRRAHKTRNVCPDSAILFPTRAHIRSPTRRNVPKRCRCHKRCQPRHILLDVGRRKYARTAYLLPRRLRQVSSRRPLTALRKNGTAPGRHSSEDTP